MQDHGPGDEERRPHHRPQRLGGARIQEGVASLAGNAYIFLRNVLASGVVPQTSAILGPCAGGAVYSPAITDFILMTRDASHMFITGPEVIRAVTHKDTTFEELGGAMTHASVSGVAHFAARDEEQCLALIRQLLGYIPQNNTEDPPFVSTTDPEERIDETLNTIIPDSSVMPYDMREIIWRVADDGQFLEIHEHRARNISVGCSRLGGFSVGIVAQQPMELAGALDIDASRKAARFGDAFNIPLVTFVDVPGFLPGVDQEQNGIILNGAKLLWAYREATVPKITFITRKAYGGAYDMMSPKHIRGDVSYAWPTAEIAVMGPEGAINIVFREEIGAADDPDGERERLAQEYRDHYANPYGAAARGHIDDVIEPQETRPRLIEALRMLRNKRDANPPKKRGNIPLSGGSVARPLAICDLMLRDGHQSLFATRMRTRDMLPIAGLIDEAGYWAVEMWGGATFDSAMRFLGENPWERIRRLKARMPATPFMMLLRGQNVVGYHHYPDDVVERFIVRARANGIDIFRIFDALNDVRNMRWAMEVAAREGAHVQATICYTTGPPYDLSYFVQLARRLSTMGAHLICVKDMAGLITPGASYELVRSLKRELDVPIHLHSSATSGMATAALVKAAEAGVDIVDTAISSLSLTTSHTPTEAMVAMLSGTDRDTGLDLSHLAEISSYFADIRRRYGRYESGMYGVDVRVLQYQIPGGMLSNLVSQLRQQGAQAHYEAVLAEVPRVRAELGYSPLVTPSSQIVGTQATLNALLGERYQVIPEEVRQYVRGFYGRPPAPADRSRSEETGDWCRGTDRLPPRRPTGARDGQGVEGAVRPRSRRGGCHRLCLVSQGGQVLSRATIEGQRWDGAHRRCNRRIAGRGRGRAAGLSSHRRWSGAVALEGGLEAWVRPMDGVARRRRRDAIAVTRCTHSHSHSTEVSTP